MTPTDLPKAFQDQACCISKTGDTVTIQCDDADYANNLFEWLSELPDSLGGPDPVDELVDLLAPVLTNSQGMAARERESRFRRAIAALRAKDHSHG